MRRPPTRSTLFPYTTLFRSTGGGRPLIGERDARGQHPHTEQPPEGRHLAADLAEPDDARSEEHTSELQSLAYLVCRLLLEKKKITTRYPPTTYRYSSCHRKP